MAGHGHKIPLELVGTMIEMADVAWNAMGHLRERKVDSREEEDINRLKCENHRLKVLLGENLSLLYDVSQTPSLGIACPPDLCARLSSVVDSPNFLCTLESLNQEIESSQDAGFQCTKGCADQDVPDVMIKANEDDPSCWVLVARNMSPECTEEVSGIDSENYIIINEENVVEGIANFIARCVIENPKSKMTSPIELQKAVNKALGEIGGWNKLKYVWEAGKVIYALSTWGIFLAGLYSHRAIVKAAAKGIHASSKFVLNSM